MTALLALGDAAVAPAVLDLDDGLAPLVSPRQCRSPGIDDELVSLPESLGASPDALPKPDGVVTRRPKRVREQRPVHAAESRGA